MVNLFPILFLALLGHTILRVFLGLSLVYLGVTHFRKQKEPLVNALILGFPFLGRAARYVAFKYALVEVVIGLMFVVGILTQAAAIAGMILSLKMLVFRKKFTYPLVPQPLFWMMVFGASSSLLITGAGALAFDFPI